VEAVPGRIPDLFRDDDVALFRAEDRVFEAMLHGWRAQMLARGLVSDTITARVGTVQRFQGFTNEYPWRWRPTDVDEFFAGLRCRSERGLALSTLRSYSNAVAMFCSYVSDPRYEWVPFCERTFGQIPSQVCFEWNTPRHSADDAHRPARRAFTKVELQRLFDAADDLVDAEYAKGSKRWLPALRDSIAFKVCYAYGLRRRELTMLELTDFGPNPHVLSYGGYGAVQVRWAKGTAGSGPRRRTVLTCPEFEWIVDILGFWINEGRRRFPTADRSDALWPSERGDRVTLERLGASFHALRKHAGLPDELGLHALRHSYVTHLIEAGYDPLFVQQQVGHYAGDRCQVDRLIGRQAGHDAVSSSRASSPSKTFCRPSWPLSAASSRCRCRVGRKSMVVWKNVHDSQMDSK